MKSSKVGLAARWLALGALCAGLEAGTREAAWQRVEEAARKGLPKTAIAELAPIIQGALADRAWAEAVKAIARKVAYEGQVQGNRTEESIVRLEAELANGPNEIAPVLHTLLAHWYWQYFQQSRWRFMRRTATAASPGKDFTTWDLPRLFAEIDRQFGLALAADRQLKATPIAAYDALLGKGNVPDNCRPTLYDFLAQEALAFYTSGEQAAARPEDAFEIADDSRIFAPAKEFIAWQPAATDTNSPALKAVRLYQEVLRFHLDDPDAAALLDADIARLVYGRNVAVGDDGGARFRAALEALVKRYGDEPGAALALYRWASAVREEGNLVEARRLALRGRQAHPGTPGGRLCATLAAEIEAKSASLSCERTWNAPWPNIRVHYRNVTHVWFRAVAWDWEVFLKAKPGFGEELSPEQQQQVLATPPALAWEAPLPPTADFKEHTVELPAPATLKPGYYFLVASHNATFANASNQVSLAGFWVSDLALVFRPRTGRVEGFVLNALLGKPLGDAKVEAWAESDAGDSHPAPSVSTDTNGFFALPERKEPPRLLRATYQGQQIVVREDAHPEQGPERVEPHTRTVLFTDRALYRPGQSVQYKGICLRVDQAKDNYTTLAGQRVTVVLSDPNDKEIARQEHVSNDYGSFAGSFTAPGDRLLGRMSLRVVEGPEGAAWVQVEEYKRPKFQVTLDAPKTAARLNDKVSLAGRATSYTGAAVDGARVKYRVVREVRMPWWWARLGGGRRGAASQEIARGAARTGPDGSFQLEFVARPDRAVPEKDQPTFVFSAHADVTDAAGETRSADRGVRLGYTALEARVEAKDWQTDDHPVELAVRTTTLDDEPQVAEGKLRVHALAAPTTVQRAPLPGDYGLESYLGKPYEEDNETGPTLPEDLSNPDHWPLGQVVAEHGFTTDRAGKATWTVRLPVGLYRAVLETQDRFGKKVTGQLPLRVLQPAASKLELKVPHVLALAAESLEPGQDLLALWGTGYATGRAFVEIEHRDKLVQRYWTEPERTQSLIQQTVTEAMRGGFTLRVTFVRQNRAYFESRRIEVPWSNKELALRWEHFTSKLAPGKPETWSAVVAGPKAEKAVAEVVATLYDGSLDAFVRHSWSGGFVDFRQDFCDARAGFANFTHELEEFYSDWDVRPKPVSLRYRTFPPELTVILWGPAYAAQGARVRMRYYSGPPSDVNGDVTTAMRMTLGSTDAAGGQEAAGRVMHLSVAAPARSAKGVTPIPGAEQGAAAPAAARGTDLAHVAARKNLNETAFFFPQLLSDSNGVVRLTFTMPEALTEWRFLGFAHDRECRSGLLEGKAVTARDLMVQPNPPRFLREGDVLEFTVKVLNQGDRRVQGKVRLGFTDALTGQPADAKLGNRQLDQPFDMPAKESRAYSWRLSVPDGLAALAYKAVAATDKVSDGEEGLLPVLARRVLVTESLPLPMRGPATKQFEFTKLANAAKSSTLAHQSLTVQVVSHPAWYAVMALPFLMEFPYECSEQTFNRYYANALARFIANANPRIRQVFDLWKGTKALESPLEKNAELKAVALEETPWVRQAQDESQARKNIGALFDQNRLDSEFGLARRKLGEAQLPEGGWSWFPGGPADDYITLYIVTGFGRLRHLGVDVKAEPALRALKRLDGWIDKTYRDLQSQPDKDENHLSSTIALYLYGRSFYLKDSPVGAAQKAAVDYFLGQARRYWLQLGSRQSQAHVALGLQRFGDAATPRAILKSLKERAVTNEEMGMFWRDTEPAWWWPQAPIETQALMIEAFGEVANDAQAVEDCKVWLLKQKQTQDWKTTKATADAVYALLLRGRESLAATALMTATLGGREIKPEQVEAGAGFYERRFSGPAIQPAMSRITLKKTDEGVAWGSVHWQYLEDISKVTPHEGTPLRLKKALFIKKNTARGPVLEAVKGPVAVGDELVVRLELRTDRALEYVHLKDGRGSGTEPLNVLSGYRWQDALGYYETTRDTASHFFIAYLPEGTHVFEYGSRVVQRGVYQTGMAAIQCMYAPEFNSHSESLRLEVR